MGMINSGNEDDQQRYRFIVFTESYQQLQLQEEGRYLASRT